MEEVKMEVTFASSDNCRKGLIEYFMKDGDTTEEEMAHTSTDTLINYFLTAVFNSNTDYENIDVKISAVRTVLE